LFEGDRHEELMGVEVNVVADSHTTVDHAQLLHLELSNVEGSGGRIGCNNPVVNPERRGGVQGAGDLNLLRFISKLS
jgi:hypothetical protein